MGGCLGKEEKKPPPAATVLNPQNGPSSVSPQDVNISMQSTSPERPLPPPPPARGECCGAVYRMAYSY